MWVEYVSTLSVMYGTPLLFLRMNVVTKPERQRSTSNSAAAPCVKLGSRRLIPGRCAEHIGGDLRQLHAGEVTKRTCAGSQSKGRRPGSWRQQATAEIRHCDGCDRREREGPAG